MPVGSPTSWQSQERVCLNRLRDGDIEIRRRWRKVFSIEFQLATFQMCLASRIGVEMNIGKIAFHGVILLIGAYTKQKSIWCATQVAPSAPNWSTLFLSKHQPGKPSSAVRRNLPSHERDSFSTPDRHQVRRGNPFGSVALSICFFQRFVLSCSLRRARKVLLACLSGPRITCQPVGGLVSTVSHHKERRSWRNALACQYVAVQYFNRSIVTDRAQLPCRPT